jgi:hypothetical protein
VVWWIEWGDSLEALEAMQAEGIPVKALENAPRYRPDLAAYLSCYMDVSAERSFNGQVTFSAVSHWCDVYDCDVSDFWPVVRIADIQVRKWQRSNSGK